MKLDAFAQAVHDWQNYYTMLGEVSATLTGLMFVAASLGARLIDETAGPKVRTFITPTVVYFSLVLLISALMNVPSQTRLSLTAEFAALGLFGTGYSLTHLQRLGSFRQEGITGSQVWVWNLILPLAASLGLLGTAAVLQHSPADGLNLVGVSVLLLVIVGLHNAWNVTLRLVRMTPA